MDDGRREMVSDKVNLCVDADGELAERRMREMLPPRRFCGF